MASITKQQRIHIYIFGAALLIPNIISEIGLYSSIKYGNFTETITNGKESITLLISTASVFISFVLLFMTNNSLDITENALKLTDKTLKLTEIEQEIRDIEKSLDLFYYPLKDYLEEARYIEANHTLVREKNKTERIIERYNEIRRDIAPYRYLATEETRIKFETLRLNGYQLRNPAQKHGFLDDVNDDIISKEKRRDDLKTTLTK
jgi:hypothetical protein